MRGFGSIARIPAGSSSVTVAHTIDSRRARSLASACDPRDRSVDRYGADVFVGSFARVWISRCGAL